MAAIANYCGHTLAKSLDSRLTRAGVSPIAIRQIVHQGSSRHLLKRAVCSRGKPGAVPDTRHMHASGTSRCDAQSSGITRTVPNHCSHENVRRPQRAPQLPTGSRPSCSTRAFTNVVIFPSLVVDFAPTPRPYLSGLIALVP